MYTIALDAGHGPNTAGKRTPMFDDGTFMHEYDFNNAVLKLLRARLSENGNFEVDVCSADGYDKLLSDRVKTEKFSDADLFLSIHANAMTGEWGNAKGIETFWNKGSSKGEKFAKIFQNNLVSDTGLYNRNAKSAPGPYYPTSLYVLRNTYAPAVLIECGFMDNKVEASKLITSEYRTLCSESLYKSILEIFNVTDTLDYKSLYEAQKQENKRLKAKLNSIHLESEV